MATPVIETSSTYATGGSSTDTHVVDYPTGLTSGELVLAVMSADNPSGVTFSWPAGFTELFDLEDTDGFVAASAAYRTADGTEGATFTVTTSASKPVAGKIYRISGSTGAPEYTQKADDGNTTTHNPPSITPSGGSDDYLYISVLPFDTVNITVDTYPTGYINTGRIDSFTSGSQTGIAFCDKSTTASTTDDPSAYVLSATRRAIPTTFAIKPAGGGDTNVTTTSTSLTLTENAATVSHDVNVNASVVSLVLTENQSTIALGVNIETNVEALVLTEQPATILLDVNVAANTASLSLTELPATITAASGDTNVLANTASLVLTENTATISYDVEVAAASAGLSLTTAQATVQLGVNVLTQLASLVLTEQPASVTSDVTVNTSLSTLTLATYPATIVSGGTTLTAQDIANIVNAIFTHIVENAETFEEQIRLIRAEAAGKLLVSGTTVSIRDAADSKDRITATVDNSGQRTSVSVDGS